MNASMHDGISVSHNIIITVLLQYFSIRLLYYPVILFEIDHVSSYAHVELNYAMDVHDMQNIMTIVVRKL